MSFKIFFGAIVLIAGVYFQGINSVQLSVSKLNTNQHNILGQFRTMVEKDLPHQYMKEDAYLMRWLSAKDFNLKEAAELLRQHLKWRDDEKIDSVLEEDWSDFEKRFPYQFISTKEDRPVLYYHFGAWDISKEASSGDFGRLTRYVTAKFLEEGDRKVRAMKKDDDNQFDIVINLDGYSLEKHGCLQCVSFYRDLFSKSESHYTGAVDNVFIVNAPSAFQNAFSIISRGFMMSKSLESTKVLGGRDTYEPVLLQHINKEQFPASLK